MGAVTLPTSPGYVSYRAFLVEAGGVQRGALGGVGQRINRLGDRWGITVQLPPMRSGTVAMAYCASLIDGLREGVYLNWPQPGFTVSNPGALKVNGAGQTGTTLFVTGGTAGTPIKKGQFFTYSDGVLRHHLAMVMADATLDAISGAAALSIRPAIRKSPTNLAGTIWNPPFIEGWLQDGSDGWDVDRARTVGLSFTVIEK